MTLTQTQMARLPVAVRHYISKLEADMEYWRRKAQAGPDESDTFADGTPAENERYGLGCTPLGVGRKIVFVLPTGAITARVEHGAVRLSTNDQSYIAALPSSANALNVIPHDPHRARTPHNKTP